MSRVKAARKGLVAVGWRKTAVARAYVRSGSGVIRVNSRPIQLLEPEEARIIAEEPILIASLVNPDLAKSIDIDVNVSGGGVMGQAQAIRMAIARALVKWSRDKKLDSIFREYDRTMLVGDPRQTEPKKFGGPGPRRRRQKSYR
ncbi:MAG: 30S ribosomal protein S9 [Candidatus Bathyarchaeota archaeon]|nr:30S ribosomal protein S9 [Candidatus Bathyarchaeota archaeon]